MASTQTAPFLQSYKALLVDNASEKGVDYKTIKKTVINDLIAQLQQINTALLTPDERQVLLINTYNFIVISEVIKAYPIASVAEIPQFFKTPRAIPGLNISLDDLEALIIKESNNPMLHMLLNCGAKSCPPLQYVSHVEHIDSLVRTAMRAPHIYQKDKKSLKLSQIFQWNAKDWPTPNALRQDINLYTQPSPKKAQLKSHAIALPISYLAYDWMLNDTRPANQGTGEDYYPTQLYRKGAGELKIFNNNYTQLDNGFRSNFFSSFIQLLVGTNRNLNIGLDIKLRSVNQGNVGALSALAFRQRRIDEGGPSGFARAGISGIGPRIKYQPKGKGHISILHTVYFVPMREAEGNAEFGYSDYNNLQIFNQLFYEKALQPKTRLFLDIGFHIENIKLGVHRNELHTTPIQIPVTAIYNYYPTSDLTLYGLGSFGQRIDLRFAPDTDTYGQYSVYGQIGAGVKYYVSDFLELELLYTNFLDTTPGRQAHTYNLGLRFFRF